MKKFYLDDLSQIGKIKLAELEGYGSIEELEKKANHDTIPVFVKESV